MTEGRDLTMRLLRDAGFTKVESVPTDGHAGIFATPDAGAPRTLGVYFMYDVKQVDPKEWSSPPWDAALVDLPKLGKGIMGRGAVNQKGPQASFLAALHAIRGAGHKLPVNLGLVAEGEEEIGSPPFPAARSARPEPSARQPQGGAVKAIAPAGQGRDGRVGITLGAKGVIELELVSSGETWGRGPKKDIHSGNRARVDSPPWHLVQALHSLVTPAGDPAIDGLFDKVRPISGRDRAYLDEAARRGDEAGTKPALGVERWGRDGNGRPA